MNTNMENIIIKYLNNSISEDEKEILLAWLKEKEGNKKEFIDTCNIWLAANNIQISEDELDNALDRLKNNINAYSKPKKVSSRFFTQKIAAAAAFILVIFSVGSFFIGRNSLSQPETVKLISFGTGQDSKDTLVLPDGSRVWLNIDSRLTYVDNFEGSERIVKLEGEAFFDVVKNTQKPFVVEAGDVKIKVTGTEFDIKNYENQTNIEASLLSGEVKVYLKGHDKEISLSPSERIIINKDTKSFDINNFDESKPIVWTNKELVLSDEKLADIFEKLGYWYGVNVVCEDGINLEQKLSFIVRGETKEELFKTIALIAPIRYDILDDTITVKTR